MNSFNTQLQIEDMFDQDDCSYWAAVGRYWFSQGLNSIAEWHSGDYDRDSQDLRWENIYMDINNEYQDNQPKPW